MSAPRRLRRSVAMRRLATETQVRSEQLIQPHFVVPGHDARTPVTGLPGIDRVTPERIADDIAADLDHGLATVLLFGVSDHKDPEGRSAAEPDGPVPRAVRAIKDAFGDRVVVMTDVCLCAYTTHGHCGIPDAAGHIRDKPTIERLADVALVHADAGADWVAPSDMMDGRIRAIRHRLDEAGHDQTAILSYAVKYASAYYGPFRDAAGSSPANGDRRTHQMDPANVREARKEALLDVSEGADALMVKPALAYLDVIRAVREVTDLPLACYNVSGEYAMVKAAAAAGAVDEAAIVRENLTAMARAGADWIITYHARDAIRNAWL